MKNLFAIVLLYCFFTSTLTAQSVSINSDGTSANADAILHLKSTSKGLLIPSVTTNQRTNINNISNGLLVYDNQTNSFWFRDSGVWHELAATDDLSADEIKDTDNNTKIQVEEGNNDNQIRFDIDGEERLVMKQSTNGELLIEPSNSTFNTFLGNSAGTNTDPSSFPNGYWNSFFGNGAGNGNQSGSYNTYIGRYAGHDNQTGDQNTMLGANAGENFTSGDFNTLTGYFSGQTQAIGNENVYMGHSAGSFKTSGNENTIIGYRAGRNNGTGSGNVFLGHEAGLNESGSNKLYIENSSSSSPLIYGDFSTNLLRNNGTFYVNSTSSSSDGGQLFFEIGNADKFSIGYYTSTDYLCIKDEENNDRMMYFKNGLVGIQQIPSTNDLEVGGTASKSTAGDWLANSDARLKKNIEGLDSKSTLEKLMQLNGVSYEWNDHRPDFKRPEGIQYGFTAQNIQQVFPELVSEDNHGYLQTSYGTYDAMYIEAIRELVHRIETLENKLESLEAQQTASASK